MLSFLDRQLIENLTHEFLFAEVFFVLTLSFIALLSIYFYRDAAVISYFQKETDLRKRNLQKRFLALVFGVPNQLKGMISVPLTKVLAFLFNILHLF